MSTAACRPRAGSDAGRSIPGFRRSTTLGFLRPRPGSSPRPAPTAANRRGAARRRRPPAGPGPPLIGLATLWLLGRIVCLVSATLPLWLAAGVDLAFLVALCAVAAHEIIAARNWHNLMIPVPIVVLGIADLLMYLECADYSVPTGLGWHLGIVAIIALISVIGGRTMVLAVMIRVSRGHTGRALEGDRITIAIYLMITAAAIVRVVAACVSDSAMTLLAVSAILWAASFGLFAVSYGPLLLLPPVDASRR